jgi:tRNA (guanine37-N1)-methyltransferase
LGFGFLIMYIAIITLFPRMFQALNYGIVKRAIDKNLLELECYNPRDYTTNRHRRVDDVPYGGGPGMVMQYEPLKETILNIKRKRPNTRLIYLSPCGKPLKQKHLAKLSKSSAEYILLCGRYEGVDQRLLDAYVDVEYSIGDYILTGGEIPAMVLVDGLTRLLENALGDETSALNDSFSNNLLEYPHYTRPAIIDGRSVPDVLLSGNHQAIKDWRMQQSLKNTWQRRKDLVKQGSLNEEVQQLLNKLIKEHHHE